nr:hypothetical protein [Comamonas testosteroni]
MQLNAPLHHSAAPFLNPTVTAEIQQTLLCPVLHVAVFTLIPSTPDGQFAAFFWRTGMSGVETSRTGDNITKYSN